MTEFNKALEKYVDDHDEIELQERFAKMLPLANGELTALILGYGQGLKYGAGWAYKYMCNEDHQFALYRSVQDRLDKLTQEAELLAEALEFYKDAGHSDKALNALTRYRASNK